MVSTGVKNPGVAWKSSSNSSRWTPSTPRDKRKKVEKDEEEGEEEVLEGEEGKTNRRMWSMMWRKGWSRRRKGWRRKRRRGRRRVSNGTLNDKAASRSVSLVSPLRLVFYSAVKRKKKDPV